MLTNPSAFTNLYENNPSEQHLSSLLWTISSTDDSAACTITFSWNNLNCLLCDLLTLLYFHKVFRPFFSWNFLKWSFQHLEMFFSQFSAGSQLYWELFSCCVTSFQSSFTSQTDGPTFDLWILWSALWVQSHVEVPLGKTLTLSLPTVCPVSVCVWCKALITLYWMIDSD